MINSSMQLKAKVRNLSGGDNARSRVLIRNFFMERFLERMALSPYIILLSLFVPLRHYFAAFRHYFGLSVYSDSILKKSPSFICLTVLVE